MICHQGSARASQRLRQGSVRQPKVSPLPSKAHALYPATPTPHTPQKPHGTTVHPALQGPGCPPRRAPLLARLHRVGSDGCGTFGKHRAFSRSPGTRGVQASAAVTGLPGDPSTCSTRLPLRLRSAFRAERLRRVETSPSLSAAMAKPIRAGMFSRVFHTSAYRNVFLPLQPPRRGGSGGAEGLCPSRHLQLHSQHRHGVELLRSSFKTSLEREYLHLPAPAVLHPWGRG